MHSTKEILITQVLPAQTEKKEERYLHLDIAKFIMVFSFMLAHFFPHSFGGVLQWNTAGFVLMSGYITGLLLPVKPLSFAYGIEKFLKINMWMLIYLLLMYTTYDFAGMADSAFAEATLYMSVLEYIALFYLLMPFFGFIKAKNLVALALILLFIIVNYVAARTGMAHDTRIATITNLLLIGGSLPYPHYPLLSFVNIGILGFLFSVVETSLPFRKPITTFIVIVFGILYFLNASGIISFMPSRHPPLIFYIVFSLAMFSIILDGSRRVGESISNAFVSKMITDTARYSIVIFVVHGPVFFILRRLNIHQAVMSGNYLADLILSVALVLFINFAFCFIIKNTLGRLPPRIIRNLL